MKYPRRRRTLRPHSFKLTPEEETLLDRLAAERHLTRSDVVREALRAYAAGASGAPSAASLAGPLVGSLDGPPDLSTASRHMSDFGE
jgi:hypothetical protein